jgi:2-dehydro-3-deoxygluconokinase
VADRWPAAWYVVKRGPAPAELRSSDGVRHVPVEQVVNPLDTTGAGDAFAAGFLTALLNGADPLGAAQAGHRVAARALLSPGATLSS